MRFPLLAVSSLCLLALGAPAIAHPLGATGVGVAAGFAHPLGGLDHVLAMIAVGLWAAQLGGRALWLVPATFVAAMAAGAALGVAAPGLPSLELGVAGSVLLLGLLVAFAVRAPTALGLVLIAAFALCHGQAHGSDLPAGAGLLYGAGFVAATAALHGIGIGFGLALRARPALRWGGAGIAAAGLALLLL